MKAKSTTVLLNKKDHPANSRLLVVYRGKLQELTILEWSEQAYVKILWQDNTTTWIENTPHAVDERITILEILPETNPLLSAMTQASNTFQKAFGQLQNQFPFNR